MKISPLFSAGWLRRGVWAAGAVLGALSLVLMLFMALEWMGPHARVLAVGPGPNGVITDTTVADFSASAVVSTNVSVADTAGGEVRLAASVEDYFDYPNSFPNNAGLDASRWITDRVGSYSLVPAPSMMITDGVLTLDGWAITSTTLFDGATPTRFFEAWANLQPWPNRPGWPYLGFMHDPSVGILDKTPILGISERLFVGRDITDTLIVHTYDGGGTDPLTPTTLLGNEDFSIPFQRYRLYRIEWTPAETRYLVDGTVISTVVGGMDSLNTWAVLAQWAPTGSVVSDTQYSPGPLQVDWVRAGTYPSSGLYTSSVKDAGQIVNWSQLEMQTLTPLNTGVAVSTSTSLDGVTWTNWAPVNGISITSPSGQYLRYQLALTSTDVMASPEVGQVVIHYFGPTHVLVTPANALVAPTPGTTQTFSAQAYDDNGRPVSDLVYAWGLAASVAPHQFDLATGVFTASNATGNFPNVISATIQTLDGPVVGTASVVVGHAPVADAGGPYFVTEAQTVTLLGTGSDINTPTLNITETWDLDNSGQFQTLGNSAVFTGVTAGPNIVAFRVVNDWGVSTIVTTTVTVTNVAPSINQVLVSGPVKPHQPALIQVLASDPGGAADVVSYAFDCQNTNTYQVAPSGGHSFSCQFITSGPHTVNIKVTDRSGAVTTYAQPVSVLYQTFLPALRRP